MKTVIEMARKTRLDVYAFGTNHEKFVTVLERFAELVRADEREACAKMCENYVEGYDRDYRELGLELADEIRSRKT